MSNIRKLPNRKPTQKKSSVVSMFPKHGTRGLVVNIEEKINKAIELRLERFVKEIQAIKAKQKRIENRQKLKNGKEKGTIDSIKKTRNNKKVISKSNSKNKSNFIPKNNNTKNKKKKPK